MHIQILLLTLHHIHIYTHRISGSQIRSELQALLPRSIKSKAILGMSRRTEEEPGE